MTPPSEISACFFRGPWPLVHRIACLNAWFDGHRQLQTWLSGSDETESTNLNMLWVRDFDTAQRRQLVVYFIRSVIARDMKEKEANSAQDCRLTCRFNVRWSLAIVARLLRCWEICKDNQARDDESKFHMSGKLQDLECSTTKERKGGSSCRSCLLPSGNRGRSRDGGEFWWKRIGSLEELYKLDNNLSTYTHKIDEMFQSLSSPVSSTGARQRMIS